MDGKITSWSCRVCGSEAPLVFTLRDTPRFVQTLVHPDQLADDQPRDLNIRRCAVCGLVQLTENVSSGDIYGNDYLCSLSFSSHAQSYQVALAERWVGQYGLAGKKVLEIGGGAGFFSRTLQSLGCDVTMVEPAPRACQAAREGGVKRVIEGYLNAQTFTGTRFDVIVSRHVLEHVSQPSAFLTMVRRLMQPEGNLFVEVPSLDAIVAKGRIQDFYAEHVCYFDPQSLTYALAKAGYEIVELYGIESGDYLACVARNPSTGLNELATGLEAYRTKFRALVQDALGQGRRVAVWGAGGRGVALLAHVGAGDLGFRFVVDSDPSKWGHLTPATHLPVVSPEYLRNNPVDDILITASAFQEEILRQLAWFPAKGRRIGVVHPEPHWLMEVQGAFNG